MSDEVDPMDVPIVSLHQLAGELINDIEANGLCDALGVAPLRPGMYVDPQKCKCGGGCESVLECDFWYYIRKTNAMERNAARQWQVGRYRVDAIFNCDGKTVVVELDGAEFHKDERKDLNRVKDLLLSVDTVIRIPYQSMHFYPRATFAVLGNWFPRFALRGQDVCCMTTDEFVAQLRNEPYGEGDFVNEREYLEWADPNYELWMPGGWVGSPKAWMHQWNVKILRRFDSSERHRQEHKPT